MSSSDGRGHTSALPGPQRGSPRWLCSAGPTPSPSWSSKRPGGYERLPFALLWEAGLPVAIVNPRAVRDFAKGMGILEKTDRRDAAVLAWSAAVRQVAAQPPPSGEQRRWTALVTCLR